MLSARQHHVTIGIVISGVLRIFIRRQRMLAKYSNVNRIGGPSFTDQQIPSPWPSAGVRESGARRSAHINKLNR